MIAKALASLSVPSLVIAATPARADDDILSLKASEDGRMLYSIELATTDMGRPNPTTSQ